MHGKELLTLGESGIATAKRRLNGELGAFTPRCLITAAVTGYLCTAKNNRERASEVAHVVLFSSIPTIVVLPAELAYRLQPG